MHVHFDGVRVPVTASWLQVVSALTTAALQAEIGQSSTQYGAFWPMLPGYISNVAVFDAVLSASTTKDHYTQKTWRPENQLSYGAMELR